ncbi:MAG: ABC transporter permease [Sedimentisphaerales bacterium]
MKHKVDKTRRGGGAMRLRGLVRKEFFQVIRDPSSIAIALVMPVVLLILFGYGVSLDAKHIPIAIVLEDRGPDARSFVAEFQGTDYFDPLVVSDRPAAEELMTLRKVKAIVTIRQDFSRNLNTYPDASIQVIVDGTDANYGRLVQGYVAGAWGKWLEHVAQVRGRRIASPVQVQQRIWFNREVRSRNFLVPGLIAVIMTLIGALLTAMVMTREWERGTMEALLVTPIRMREIILSKLITYFILGISGMIVSVVMGIWLFNVPLRGSFIVLFATSSLFLLVALGMGLLISSVTRNQFVAGQIAIITTFLPAFLLSGFIFDIASMPIVVQQITRIIAARYFVAILQTVFLAGNVGSVIVPNSLALLIMGLVFFTLIRMKSKKRIE